MGYIFFFKSVSLQSFPPITSIINRICIKINFNKSPITYFHLFPLFFFGTIRKMVHDLTIKTSSGRNYCGICTIFVTSWTCDLRFTQCFRKNIWLFLPVFCFFFCVYQFRIENKTKKKKNKRKFLPTSEIRSEFAKRNELWNCESFKIRFKKEESYNLGKDKECQKIKENKTNEEREPKNQR